MKHLALIAALVATPALAEGPDEHIEIPSPGIVYTDGQIVFNAFACALIAGAAVTGPSSAAAAAGVFAAGACTLAMDLGLPLPTIPDRNYPSR